MACTESFHNNSTWTVFLNNVYAMFLKIAAVRIKKEKRCFRFFLSTWKMKQHLNWCGYMLLITRSKEVLRKKEKKDRQTLFTIKNWLYPLSITHPDENIICFTLTYNSGFYYDYVTQCSGHIMAWCLGLKTTCKIWTKTLKKTIKNRLVTSVNIQNYVI